LCCLQLTGVITMVRRRRGPLEIAAQLLQLAIEPRKKADLMYEARLDFRGLQRNLRYLNDMGLLENTGSWFRTTQKGSEFLRRYGEMAKMLVEG